MVVDGVNLNHALEKENIRVVETDLGEFIVQLRGEKPSSHHYACTAFEETRSG
ncbi:MAG: hypothetical protein U0V48_16970 [Anaerolineales bacterium]